jgi:hypothetical protein
MYNRLNEDEDVLDHTILQRAQTFSYNPETISQSVALLTYSGPGTGRRRDRYLIARRPTLEEGDSTSTHSGV